ncbi:MAG: hypothetical protein L3J08_03475 [Flavobacteriaceae bacterium]|nr:hypothetical protein [Flavobacteriaceae bacterium]
MSIVNQDILSAISKININKKVVLKFILIIILSTIVSIGASYMAEETVGGISGAWSAISRMTIGFSKVMILFFTVWVLTLWINKKK